MSRPIKLPTMITDLSIEQAYEIAEQLEGKQQHESMTANTVFTGVHPVYGAVHVVIPPLGDASLLPIVIQKLEL